MPALVRNIMGAGVAAGLANVLLGDVQDSMTAAGTSQSDAQNIGAAIARFTTVASGAGAILPAGSVGDELLIINAGANALSLYPPIGHAINAGATNAAFSIPTASSTGFKRVSNLLWIALDASQLSFLQSGTGAVSRTVQARLRDLVSILDFIPVAEHAAIAAQTSTTTLTTYIQAALDEVNTNKRGGLYVPAGLYNTGTINWPGNNIALIGAGSGYGYDTSSAPQTIFKAVAGTTIMFDLVQTGTAVDRQGSLISDIKLDGNSVASSVGIHTALANIVERCTFTRFQLAGIQIGNFGNSNRIIGCNFILSGGYSLYIIGASTTTNTIRDCIFEQSASSALRIEGGFGMKFENCVFESNSGGALSIFRPDTNDNHLGDIQFENCWFEDNGTAAIAIDSNTRSEERAPIRIRFKDTHISVSDNAHTYFAISCGKLVSFEGCHFNNSTATGALATAADAYECGLIQSSQGSTLAANDGLTTAQLDSFVANGTRCYVEDTTGNSAPNTQTGATYTVGALDQTIIANRAGTVTLTLPTASISKSRKLRVVTIQAQQVDSASANVVPRAGGAAGTAILGASDGAWADLECDGSNWIITASS